MQRNADRALLTLLREALGWTQRDLSVHASIPQSSLCRFEAGDTSPDEDTYRRWLSALGCSDEFLSGSRTPLHFHTACLLEFSIRRRLNAREVHQTLAQAAIIISCVLRELSEQGGNALTGGESARFPRGDCNPEDLARILRSHLCLSSTKGDMSLTEALEDLGVLVIPFSFASLGLKAVSTSTASLTPVICLNSALVADERRYAIAHELGHFCLAHAQAPTRDQEIAADEFANELLMPAQDFDKRLPHLNLSELLTLNDKWKVPIDRLLERALNLGAISLRQYRRLKSEVRKAGPLLSPRRIAEEPVRNRSLVDASLIRLRNMIVHEGLKF